MSDPIKVGDKLWFVPERRWCGLDRFVTVEKVGRKWAYFERDYKFDIKTLAVSSGGYSRGSVCHGDPKFIQPPPRHHRTKNPPGCGVAWDRTGHSPMTRAEETARVAALRAAFAASDEPDVFRWFARQQDQQSAAEPARDRTDHAWDVIADMESF